MNQITFPKIPHVNNLLNQDTEVLPKLDISNLGTRSINNNLLNSTLNSLTENLIQSPENQVLFNTRDIKIPLSSREIKAELFNENIENNFFQITDSELSKIPFNQLLENPRKITDLFSYEFKELVEGLVAVHKDKTNDNSFSLSTFNLDKKNPTENFDQNNYNQPFLQTNTNSFDRFRKKEPVKSTKRYQLSDEPNQKPYFEKKKKDNNNKKLNKFLTSTAQLLDRVSKEIKLLAN